MSLAARGAQAVEDASPFQRFLEETRDQPIYVILGVQGSGTNLLARILTRVFNFSVMRDRSAVFKAAVRLGATPPAQDVEREIRHFSRLIKPSALRRKTSKSVSRRGKPLPGLETDLQPSLVKSGADFARMIYSYRALSNGAAHIGIKSDDLWEEIQNIDAVIPNRRVILLTRDFRDNLVSISGKRFGPIEPVCAAEYVKRQLGHYAAEYRRAGRNGFHVKFETLLGAPHQFAEDFAAHFALHPPSAAALAALKVKPNRIGRWKGLSGRDLAWCEGILQEELREFGYPFASAGPRLPTANEMLLATTRDRIRRVPQKLRRVATRLRS
jgi:hypothetical protein